MVNILIIDKSFKIFILVPVGVRAIRIIWSSVKIIFEEKFKNYPLKVLQLFCILCITLIA